MKKVFITGGTSGIGKDLAKVYSRKGYIIGVCGRSSEKFHFSELELYQNVHFFRADVSQIDEIKKAITDFQNKFGDIDYLYANAGIGISKKKYSADFSKEHQVIGINIVGFMNTIESVLPQMLKRKSGHIVGISSLAAIIGLPGNAAYCASKSFVKMYCESLAISSRKHNIKVTTIMPGYIKTPLTKNNNHPMPFLMPSMEAAKKITAAVDRGDVYYAFPKPLYFIASFFRMFPKKLLYWGLSQIKYR